MIGPGYTESINSPQFTSVFTAHFLILTGSLRTKNTPNSHRPSNFYLTIVIHFMVYQGHPCPLPRYCLQLIVILFSTNIIVSSGHQYYYQYHQQWDILLINLTEIAVHHQNNSGSILLAILVETVTDMATTASDSSSRPFRHLL